MNNDFIDSCIIVLLKDIFYPFIILVIYFLWKISRFVLRIIFRVHVFQAMLVYHRPRKIRQFLRDNENEIKSASLEPVRQGKHKNTPQ